MVSWPATTMRSRVPITSASSSRPPPFVAGGDQGAGEVVAGVGGAGGGDLAEHREQGAVGGQGLFGSGAGGDHAFRQGVQALVVGRVDPEEFADDGHRQGQGEEAAQVGGAVGPRRLLHLVEEGVHQRGDPGAERLDARRGEGGGDRAAQPAVVGAVRGGHAGDGGEGAQRPAVRDAALAQRGEVAGVLGDIGVGEELPAVPRGRGRPCPRSPPAAPPARPAPGRGARRCRRAGSPRRVSSGRCRGRAAGPGRERDRWSPCASRPAGAVRARPRARRPADGPGPSTVRRPSGGRQRFTGPGTRRPARCAGAPGGP